MKGTLHKTEQGWIVRHCDYVLKNEFQLLLHHEDVEQLNEWVLDYPSYGITSEEVEFEIVQIASDNMGKVDTYAKLIKNTKEVGNDGFMFDAGSTYPPDVDKLGNEDVPKLGYSNNMFDLPTAEEFLDNYRAKSFYDESVNSYYIEAMLEFAKLHVKDALRRAKETLYTEEQVDEVAKYTISEWASLNEQREHDHEKLVKTWLSIEFKNFIQSLKQPKQ